MRLRSTATAVTATAALTLALFPPLPQPASKPAPKRHSASLVPTSLTDLTPHTSPSPQAAPVPPRPKSGTRRASRSRAHTHPHPHHTTPTSTAVGAPWRALAHCESTSRWDYNGPSGFDGGLQFQPSTWRAFGGREFAPYAYLATPVQQVTVARRVLRVQGWKAWPACSRKLGLR
jgi:hypothetical protein